VLPYFTTDGNPPRVRGLNSVGLRRAGFTIEARRALKAAYQILFRRGLRLEDALREMESLTDEHVLHLINFIRGSRRGFTREGRSGKGQQAEEASGMAEQL
jgi:UDP-N-acetylglucosamine acyltransferase